VAEYAMKNMFQKGRSSAAAFTLVELLVVIGLMALLGTISVGGYYAASRGMTERGAVDDTRALIRLAMQTCLIEQVPTAVLFSNRRLLDQAVDDTGLAVAGSAVAIKMAGRITYIRNNVLVDEFADWNQSYSTSGSANDAGFRFYRMADDALNSLEQGVRSCSTVVKPFVTSGDMGEEYMIGSGKLVREWCSDYKKTPADNRQYANLNYNNGNSQRWGFEAASANNGLSVSQWRVGDAYGVEIGQLRLPEGYLFGSTEPKTTEASDVPSIVFHPDDVSSATEYVFNFTPVTISSLRPGSGGSLSVQRVASVTASDLKDD
jgi:type II secretory pathway pseudopilin PulG